MTDASLLALSVAGFFGGLLVISRTLGWLVGLVALLRQSGKTASTRPWPVQLFLHSGPWLLALAVAGFVRVASLPWPAFGALCGGFGLALSIIVVTTSRAMWRARHPASAPEPLTEERLAEQRRESIFLGTAWAAIASTVAFAWMNWSTLDRDYPYLFLIAPVSAVGGWCCAVLMSETFSPSWKDIERARRRRAEREAMQQRSVR